jgi:hypothetical protein
LPAPAKITYLSYRTAEKRLPDRLVLSNFFALYPKKQPGSKANPFLMGPSFWVLGSFNQVKS